MAKNPRDNAAHRRTKRRKLIFWGAAAAIILIVAACILLSRYSGNWRTVSVNTTSIGGPGGYYINQSEANAILSNHGNITGRYATATGSELDSYYGTIEQVDPSSPMINNIAAAWEVAYATNTPAQSIKEFVFAPLQPLTAKKLYTYLVPQNPLTVYVRGLTNSSTFKILADGASYDGMVYSLYSGTLNGYNNIEFRGYKGNLSVVATIEIPTNVINPINTTTLVAIIDGDISNTPAMNVT